MALLSVSRKGSMFEVGFLEFILGIMVDLMVGGKA
jgi:hypothetical protein